jgi:hypothetical protein
MQLATTNEPTLSNTAKIVTHEKTGGLIPFKKFALQEGLNLNDKDEKKKANVLYTQAKRAYYDDGKAWAAFLLTRSELNVSRHSVTKDSEGNIKTAKLNFRAATEAESKSDARADKNQAIAERDQLARENEELKAKLAALQS